MLKTLIAVAAGGAAGAVARYLTMVGVTRLAGHGFPYGTLTVNIVGSFLMGALITFMALRWSASPEMRALIAVGVLGAFTTFSTFSLDAVTLAERGAWSQAAIYIGASVVICILALLAGMRLVRFLLA